MIEKKKKSLIKYSIRTLQNSNVEDVQTNARKSAEAFCKVMIISHYNEVRGENIIYAQDREVNKLLNIKDHQRNQELNLNMLSNLIVMKKSLIIKKCYQKKYKGKELTKTVTVYQIYLKRYLDVLIFNGNSSSHESSQIQMNNDDVIITQKILSRLLYWLYTEFLEEEIPDKLVPYIAKYDIFISYRHSDKIWVDILIKNLKLQGYKVFVDSKELVVGENYKKRIHQALYNSDCAIIVSSSDYDESEWMKKEYEWMMERKYSDSNFRVIPIMIDEYSYQAEENIHFINFSKIDYSNSFSNLICSIERKPPTENIDIVDRLEIPPIEVMKPVEENKKIKIDKSIVNKLSVSLNSELPTVIVNGQNKDREIEFFIEGIRNKFDYVYCLYSPKIRELPYAQKILVDAGMAESDEQRYIKDLTIQSKFYQNTQTFIQIKNWVDVLKRQINQDKKLFIIFQLDKEDRFYQELFSELYNILISYPKRLKIIIMAEDKQKNILNNNIFKI
jgi:hypothetical protein